MQGPRGRGRQHPRPDRGALARACERQTRGQPAEALAAGKPCHHSTTGRHRVASAVQHAAESRATAAAICGDQRPGARRAGPAPARARTLGAIPDDERIRDLHVRGSRLIRDRQRPTRRSPDRAQTSHVATCSTSDGSARAGHWPIATRSSTSASRGQDGVVVIARVSSLTEQSGQRRRRAVEQRLHAAGLHADHGGDFLVRRALRVGEPQQRALAWPKPRQRLVQVEARSMRASDPARDAVAVTLVVVRDERRLRLAPPRSRRARDSSQSGRDSGGGAPRSRARRLGAQEPVVALLQQVVREMADRRSAARRYTQSMRDVRS